MKRYISFLAGICLAALLPVSLKAQQEPYNTMFAFNKLPINPGYTGGKDILSVRAAYRYQWVGLPGSPRTLNVSVHSPLKLDRLALGLMAVNDQLGSSNMTHINATFAYRVPFKKNDTKLSFGIGAGAMVYNARVTELDRIDEGDPLAGTNLSGVRPEVSFGIYYYGTKFYAGFSIPNLIPVSLTGTDNLLSSNANRLQQYTSFWLMGGYTFEIGKEDKKNLWIQPQLLLKIAPGLKRYELPLELDANVVFTLFKTVGLGVTYRTGLTSPYQNRESVDIMAIFYLPKNFSVGYSYDQTISKVATYNRGTHEVLLGYDVNWKKGGIHTPRYF